MLAPARTGAALLAAGLIAALTAGPAMADSATPSASVVRTTEVADRSPHSLADAGSAAPSASATPSVKHDNGSSSLNPLWIAGGGLLIGIGYGVYLSKRKPRP
jgi:hypothetical protein